MELSKKQKKVMDELFEATEDENVILDHNHVTRRTFDLWLTEDAWIREFERRIEQSKRRTQIIITAFQPSAAVKLVELTTCEKEETARKACLDIIQIERIASEVKHDASAESLELSESTRDSIIELMAKDARKARTKKTKSD